jgi:hypothetical protein
VERVAEWRPIAVRGVGRTRFRGESYVRADLGKIKIQNWSKMTVDIEASKRTAEQTKTHKEL